jgi:hypothetical protein
LKRNTLTMILPISELLGDLMIERDNLWYYSSVSYEGKKGQELLSWTMVYFADYD